MTDFSGSPSRSFVPFVVKGSWVPISAFGPLISGKGFALLIPAINRPTPSQVIPAGTIQRALFAWISRDWRGFQRLTHDLA